MKRNERLKILKNRLHIYYEAEEAILSSQSYSLGSKSLTRADLAKVQDMIKSLEGEIELLESSSMGKRLVKRIIPVDL